MASKRNPGEGKLLPAGNTSRAALVAAWTKAYGLPPPKGISTRLLSLAAQYNAQVAKFGGLKPSVRKQLLAWAETPGSKSAATQTKSKKAKTTAGTRLMRQWHGKTHIVDVRDDGVLYQGRTYRSLSEVARAITGARWSGPRFFGL